MSTTIDNKVVQMEFDNSRFERNVQTSLSTLDKLRQSLNLTSSAKGFENIDSAAKKVNFSTLSSGVEAIQSKFSALQVMSITALANITNSAVNAGKRIASALTIDPIKTGFQEYETQINAVQTILANTSSKGTTLDQVNGALDQLNTYADKTIYNFTEMTRNIGTFTAAGVDLDKSVSSIQGIANLAAVSGSTSQQASTAMYQLSQALAAGKVSLMDWNSVVNAGMGGQVFQDALKRTATVMGTDVDALIKKYGSFRESLTQGEWLTTDVLTKTLEQFTMAADEGSKEWDNYKKSLMDEGYTEKQATEILKMANTATDAATKVKTFTQLWDTLKEAAQSGWTQTWEILVGDFEEAKSMLTNVSNVINEMIGKSSQVRNELLQGWKDAGGRTDVLEGFKSIFNGLMAIVTPIKEAFSDIFPAIEVGDLVGITKGFRELAKSFETFTDKHGDQIYSTFKGIFSVLEVGWTIVKKLAGGIVELISHFSGVGGGILGVTAAIGNFLTNISKTVKESDLLGKSIDFIVGILTGAIDKIKEFGSSLKEGFKAKGYEGFVGFLKATWEFVSKIGSGLTKAFSGLGQAVANVFGENSFGDVLESGGLAALSVGLFKLVNNLNKPFDSMSDMFEGLTGKDGILENVTGILDDVRGCFEAYQQQLQAGTLMKIASAIGILAASIFVISTIDPEKLGSSLGAITVLFGELLGALSIFTKIMPNIKGVMKAVPLLLGMASAMLILSASLRIIGSMEPKELMTGLLGVAGGLGALVAAVNFMPEKSVRGAAKSIRTLSVALLILSGALKIMGSMSWGELGKGLAGVAGGLAAMVAAVNLLPKSTGLRAAGMVGLATSLVILGAALKSIGSMKWTELGKGLAGLAGSLAALVIALKLMPKNMVASGVGLIGVATALVILGSALKNMGSMSWAEIGKGLTVLGVALLELSIGLAAMRNSVTGSAALLIAAGALAVLVPTLKSLGEMSGGSIAKSLLALAGAFTVIGIAGYLLAPLIPTLLGLAGTFALFGIAALAFGAGLTLIGVGIGSIAGALAAGATSIVASITVIITGLLDLIPTVVTKLGEAIKAFALVIGDCAPVIAESLLKLLSEVLKSMATYIPQIADSLFELLIGVLDVLAARMPELIVAAVKVIGAFFQGVVDALGTIDTKTMFEGIIAVGLMSGLMFALSAVVGTIPGAMAGVLGMGAVIAELAIVLAAIGGLAQIPGLSWLIEQGGNFLEKIGTAIGQFIGGLAGGIAQGFTSSLPQMATDLSNFMTNLQPFIDGAKGLDASMLEGVKSLASALLILTGADILNSIASFITGGNSLSNFGEQLVPFGLSLRAYSASVAGIDTNAIAMSAVAAKALAEMTSTIPNEGGMVAWFTGENSISKFADELPALGVGLAGFSASVAGINAENITAAANAAKSLAQMTNTIPNEGGMVAWFTGDNSISAFASELPTLGEGLKGFSDSVAGINAENITAASSAAKSLAQMAETTPKSTGSITTFGDNLAKFGDKLKTYFEKTSGITGEAIATSAGAINSVKNAATGLSASTLTSASTAIDSLVKSLKNMTSVSERSVAGFSSAMKKLGQTNVKSVISAFNNAGPQLLAAGKNAIARLTEGVKSQNGQMKNAGGDSAKKLAEGITAQTSAVNNACKKVVSGCATALKSNRTGFYNAGSYLVQGFANGISANTWRAEAKARAMANAAERAAKAALDEHSPSRVFYKIGDYAGLGFVNALRDYASVAYRSSYDMADSAKDGLSKAMRRVADVFNSDVDSQPRITPVVDLSNVQTGIGAINSMFGDGRTLGVSTNVSGVSSMMNGYNQNGNSDVISAIDRLRKSMSNLGNTTYNVNGITYDDGSNVSNAVKDIIRHTRIEGRV